MFGIESADENIFNSINKGETLETVINAVNLSKKSGISSIGGFFMINLPGSTFESDMKSVAFAKKLGITASFSIFVPYPGTKFWEILENNSKIKFLRPWQEGFSYGKKICSVYETEQYKEKDIVNMFYISNIRNYNYIAIVEGEEGVIRKTLKLMYVILRYDSTGVPVHFVKLFRILIRKAKSKFYRSVQWK
jgi:radical SAM superfamily enzyme YgiQ (UPF0313 family)